MEEASALFEKALKIAVECKDELEDENELITYYDDAANASHDLK